MIRIERTPIPGLFTIDPAVREDNRGFFATFYDANVFARHGIPLSIQEVNHSLSKRNVLRGLHFQWDPPLGKLVRVTEGDVWLVAVDIRKHSKTVGTWKSFELSAGGHALYAGPGIALGFCVMSDTARVEYLYDAPYNKDGEVSIRFDDPRLGIPWPVTEPVLSARDARAIGFLEWLERPEAESAFASM
jgi:dTDP-4-dehydrorhamnose 3,5-epimerase